MEAEIRGGGREERRTHLLFKLPPNLTTNSTNTKEGWLQVINKIVILSTEAFS